MSNELTVSNKAGIPMEQIQISGEDIKNLFCPLATEKEVKIALGIVLSQGLNPFKREVHFVKYKLDSPISIIVGYEVYIKRAERTGKLDGWSVGIDATKNTAWVKILRKDWKEPFQWEVSLSEFNKKQSTWNQIPTFMAKKVAIAQGFRMCFPDELGGMPYTKEETEVYDIEERENRSSKPEIIIEPKAIEAPKKAEKVPENMVSAPKNHVSTEFVSAEEAIMSLDTTPAEESENLEAQISKEEGFKLLKMATLNGYVKDEVKEYAKTLGYGRLSEVSKWDLPTLTKRFEEKKEVYEQRKKDAGKE